MGRVDGKVVLISGGAQGMGAAHARMLVAEGAKVVIGDILDEKGQALAAELGDSVRYVHLDVTDADQWEAAVTTAVETFGRLTALVEQRRHRRARQDRPVRHGQVAEGHRRQPDRHVPGHAGRRRSR